MSVRPVETRGWWLPVPFKPFVCVVLSAQETETETLKKRKQFVLSCGSMLILLCQK